METGKKLLALLFASVAAVAGCAATSEEDAASSDQAHTEKAEDDDDDFTVEDRMGRPEMTNVTMGAGLVRLKVTKARFATLQKQAAAETDSARRAALEAEAQKVGGELKRLAGELGAPESDELKAQLARDAVTDAAEAKALEDAARAGQPAPTFPRRVSGFFRAYNHQQTFHPKAGERTEAKRLLAAGIRALDTLVLDGDTPDGQDWSEEDLARVSDVLAEDALIVDLRGTCTHDSQSYFAVEREGLGGDKQGSSCGGRTLNDDIIDDTLTMWITRTFDFEPGNPRRVGDSVVAVRAAGTAGPYTLSPVITSFPYLGEPRATPFVGAGACSVTCRSDGSP